MARKSTAAPAPEAEPLTVTALQLRRTTTQYGAELVWNPATRAVMVLTAYGMASGHQVTVVATKADVAELLAAHGRDAEAAATALTTMLRDDLAAGVL